MSLETPTPKPTSRLEKVASTVLAIVLFPFLLALVAATIALFIVCLAATVVLCLPFALMIAIGCLVSSEFRASFVAHIKESREKSRTEERRFIPLDDYYN